MAGPQYRLVVRQGPIPGQIFELNKSEIAIGRDVSNDFVINDAEVSRKHAKLILEGDRFKIEDLNSTNGTYIDGQRLIGPHLLAIGEVIMFGDNVGVIFEGGANLTDITAQSTIELGRTPVAAIPTPTVSHLPTTAPLTPKPAKIPEPQAVEPEPEVEAENPEVAAKKPVNTWLLAGAGCLLVIIVLLIALFVFIDQPWKAGGGLYCVSPFDIIFKSLGYCP